MKFYRNHVLAALADVKQHLQYITSAGRLNGLYIQNCYRKDLVVVGYQQLIYC